MPIEFPLKQEPMQDDSSCKVYSACPTDVSSHEEVSSPFEEVYVKSDENKSSVVAGLDVNKEADKYVPPGISTMQPISLSPPSRKHWECIQESTAATTDIPAAPAEAACSSHKALLFPCPHCPETNLPEEEMQLHLQQHCDLEGKFFCGKCKFSTTDRTSFKTHARQHQDDPLLCPHCPYLTWRPLKLRIHVREQHKKDETHTCDQCGASLKTRLGLKMHCRIVHSDLVKLHCLLCSFKTYLPDKFALHNQEHETGKPVLECERCDYTTLLPHLLKRHMTAHKKEKPVQTLKCDECPFETKYNQNLLHHKKVHTEVRHNCKQCSFTTVYPNNLRQHMRLHEGEKLSCPHCPYQTTRKDSLTSHLRVHGNVEPYRCKLCPFTSTHIASLRRHLIKAHHQVKPNISVLLPGEKRGSNKRHLRKCLQ